MMINMNKKAISAWGSVMVMIVVGIIIMLLFFSFQSKGFGQEKSLFGKLGSKAMGEVPCLNAPSVSVPTATKIYPVDRDGNFKPGLTKVMFNSSISTNCAENLSITWKFKELADTDTVIETECAYPYNEKNCSSIEHIYNIQSKDLWKILPASVSAYGMISGLYTEDSTDAFVMDPTFRFVSVSMPDISDFSCVNFNVKLANYSGEITDFAANGIRLDVIDNFKSSITDRIVGAKIFYRADKSSGKHEVEIKATKGYQTITYQKELGYDAPKVFREKPEIATYNEWGKINVYTSALDSVFQSCTFRDTNHPGANFAIGDLTYDDVADFAFLMPEKILFAVSYKDLPKGISRCSTDLVDMAKLKLMWPYAELRDIDWKAVAIGQNIKDPDDEIGNIVVLGNLGDLELYRYEAGILTLVEEGGGFNPDSGDWQDVTTADIDKDGEDEIIAVRGIDTKTGDMYIFKYKDYKSVDNKKPYWLNIPYKDWKAVAAGQMDSNPNNIEIVAVGEPGDLVYAHYPFSNENDFVWISDLPDSVEWLDLAAADVDGDNVDELIFLYKYGGKNKIAIVEFDKILLKANFKEDVNEFESIATKIYSDVPGDKIKAGDFACT